MRFFCIIHIFRFCNAYKQPALSIRDLLSIKNNNNSINYYAILFATYEAERIQSVLLYKKKIVLCKVSNI